MADHIDGSLYYETMGKSGPVMAFVHPNPMDQSRRIFQMAQMSTWYRCIAVSQVLSIEFVPVPQRTVSRARRNRAHHQKRQTSSPTESWRSSTPPRLEANQDTVADQSTNMLRRRSHAIRRSRATGKAAQGCDLGVTIHVASGHFAD